MTQPQLKHQTSYREQFLSRNHLERRQSSPQYYTKKFIPASILKPRTSGKVLSEKGYTSMELRVKTPTLSKMNNQQEHHRPDSNDNDSVKLNLNDKDNEPADLGDNFREMIDSRARSLDLSDLERECLGLFKDSYLQENLEPKQNIENESSKVPNERDDQGELLGWKNLVEQFNLNRWLNVFTSSDSIAYKDDDAANAKSKPKLNNSESSKLFEDQEEAFTRLDRPYESILALFNDICNGSHSPASSTDCFKCQYKESFKSFVFTYLDKLDEIQGSKGLSPDEQKDLFRATLEMWIYQLSEQNISLAVAYDASTQASVKLKSVLLQSRNSMRTLQKENDKDKASIEALTYELSLRDKTIKKLKYEQEMQSEQTKVLEESLQDTQADVQSLTELIIRLRDKGVWDINGLPMSDETFKKIFNGDYYLHGTKVIGPKEYSTKKREWVHEIEQLKSERETLKAIITAKDKEIQRSNKSTRNKKSR